MESIIAGLLGLLATITGVALKQIHKNASERKLNGIDLAIGYPLIFIFLYSITVVALYGWYHFALTFNYPVFPKWPERTPGEWLIDAVLLVGYLGLWLCFKLTDVYLAQKGDAGDVLKARRNLKIYFAVIVLCVGAASYIYQVYFYGWWPW